MSPKERDKEMTAAQCWCTFTMGNYYTFTDSAPTELSTATTKVDSTA